MYQRSKAAKRARTPEPFNKDDWKVVSGVLREALTRLEAQAAQGTGQVLPRAKRLTILAERADEWAAHEKQRSTPAVETPVPVLTPAEKHEQARKLVLNKMHNSKADIRSEEGFWQIYGEDPNCDLQGPHSRPNLGVFQGTLSDAIDYAVDLPEFFTWGGGGTIEPVQVTTKPNQPLTVECGACRGYGYFGPTGKPSVDKRNRKCLDCNGEGHKPG
jgi:hypothetical protein